MACAKDYGLYVLRMTNVFPVPGSMPKRVLIELSKSQVKTEESDIVIEKERHIYSDEFAGLVKDFYLKL